MTILSDAFAFKVPETREEAIAVFVTCWAGSPAEVSEVGVRCMTGIYDCQIGVGKTHIEAYESALRARIGEASK